MNSTIKNTIVIRFLLVLLVLPLVLSGCGTKKVNLGITNTVDKTTVSVGDKVSLYYHADQQGFSRCHGHNRNRCFTGGTNVCLKQCRSR